MHQFKTGGYCANCLKVKSECDCLQQQLISEAKASMTQNAMLAEVLLETERWLMVNSSIPVEKIIDLREHLQKHFG